MKDRYIYPALFAYENGREDVGIAFPDLPGCVSQGNDDEDAMRMSKEALSLHLWGMEEDGDFIPEPTPLKDLDFDEYNEPGTQIVVVLIEVWMPLFREEMKNKSVTRAVTLPGWLDMQAKAARLNYSKTLQDGLMKSLGIRHQINHQHGKGKSVSA